MQVLDTLFGREASEADVGRMQLSRGLIRDCDEALCDLFGLEHAQLIGRDPVDLSETVQRGGRAAAEAWHERERSAAGGLPQEFLWLFRHSDWQSLQALVRLEAVAGEAGGLRARVRDLRRLRHRGVELQDSEARLQQVVDNTPALIYAKDRDGRLLFVNREFEHLVGRAAREIVGRTDLELFTPELAARFRRNDLRVLLEGRAIEFEESGDFAGRQRTFLSTKFPLLDAGGAIYGLCGMSTDITARKQLEDALSSAALAVSSTEGETLFTELARYLATILDMEVAFIATLHEQGARQLYLRAFHLDGRTRENFGYSMEGTPCELVVGGSGPRLFPSGLQKLFPLDNDFTALGVESYAGHPLNGPDGQPLGLIAVASRRPIERPAFVESVLKLFAVRVAAELERARAEERLRVSEASYREIFEASADAIFVHDWDTGAIVDVNPRACEIYGYSHGEFLQVGIDRLGSGAPPYTAAGAARLIERTKRAGFARAEWHRRNKDGSLHWDEVHLKSARIAGQRRVLAFTREITERKLAEERRLRLEAQLRQAQKMEALGQLTGGIAHDFNNLLTSIVGYVVLARERHACDGDARLGAYLEQAQLACDRARDLIRQMLVFSRGQKGEPRPVSLMPLLERSLTLVRPSLPGSLEVRVAIDADLPAVWLDPVQLEQVIVNLFINARDALGGSGTIALTARTVRIEAGVCASCRASVSGDFVEVSVADDGPGIPDETVERIFEPFFSTKQVGKGTGMGLATVHGIVHEHGGHVLLDTARGRGASFRVLLPPLAGDRTAVQPPEASRSTGPAPRAAFEGSVLLVDDDRLVGEFMRELLANWGLRATLVSSAAEALQALGRSPEGFDLVITDQTMPGMTGIELARTLRIRHTGLPVVLYTGFSEHLAERELEAAGVRAMLRKPIEPHALAAALGAQLRSAAGPDHSRRP